MEEPRASVSALDSAAAMEGVGVFLCFGFEIFLLHRNPQYKNNDKHDESWECPGGKIKPGETPEQAVIREVYEETVGVLKLDPRQLIEEMSVISHTTKFWRVDLTMEQRRQCFQVTSALQLVPVAEREANSLEVHRQDHVLYGLIPLRGYNKKMFEAGRKAGII